MPKADILIVDDTPTNLSLLSQILTSQDYRVRVATNGARALDSVHTLPPDLILLDIRMPGMDGFQICTQLKSEPLTREIPIIFISALDDIEDKVYGFQVGGVDYITKPFQVEEVLMRLETHLHMRSLQLQLQEANQKMAQELTLAQRMQANFMPNRLPGLPGWELAAHLQPARQTSGDFYNIFSLPNGNLAILIADVVDKGVGAALFMAYCWSLLRSYAEEHPNHPEGVLHQVNHRILADVITNQFVTIFLGILEPGIGRLVYANAGHLPPLLFHRAHQTIEKLTGTGVPLGIFEDRTWGQASTQLDRGDVLVLYTDGVTDAGDLNEQRFGEDRLVQAVQANHGAPADKIQAGILEAVGAFAGEAQQYDDVALIVLARTDQV